ncbi:MAG TPA: Gfo/Idh/MocA family oxidoreductase, partial [Gemmatales bacterium]|nr:Gfo/Idh/MocA family oxidoreductase [Gemmatales bacterium]
SLVMKEPVKVLMVAINGYGHYYLKTMLEETDCEDVVLVGVVDPNSKQAETIAAKHNCKAFASTKELKGEVDAVSIVTPTKFHCSTAIEFLAQGVPCMVEKPLASTVPEAKLIVNAAKRAGTLLQVGHIERFNPGFTTVAESCLRPKYIEAHRLAPFSGRGLDVGVVMDLMIHDIDLVLSLVKSHVVSIDATGVSIMGQHEDLANARVHFANGSVATLTASRVHPQAVRTMNLFGSEGFTSIDFGKKNCTLIQPTLSFRNGVPDVRNLDPQSMTRFKETLFSDYLPMKQTAESKLDQLTAELTDFTEAVRTGRQPKVTGEDGLAAVTLAQSIIANIGSHDWEGNGQHFGACDLPIYQGPLFHVEKSDVQLSKAA